MAVKKIPCGGFYYDDETVSFDDDIMTVVGGGNVPDPEVADIGKVLGIVEDGAGAKYAPVEGGGSGLPDPSALTDGTAIVAVNGEWKMQEGYGYTDDPAFESITWDGDTEGRESFLGSYYKVSDAVIDPSNIEGCSVIFRSAGGQDLPYTLHFGGSDGAVSIGSVGDLGISIYFVSSDFDIEETSVTKGVYFPADEYGYISSLTGSPTVHQFDSTLIPTSGVEEFVVKFEEGDDGIVADATWEDVIMAASSGKLPKGIFYAEGMPFYELQFFAEGGFINISLGTPNTLRVTTIYYDETSAWSLNTTNYTLTPAT